MHGLKSLRIYKYNVIRTFSTNSSYLSEQKLRQAYFLLDLDDSATIDEVQERYSKLLLRLHPDTGGANVS
jgi:DnaJ-class molecular chaperone